MPSVIPKNHAVFPSKVPSLSVVCMAPLIQCEVPGPHKPQAHERPLGRRGQEGHPPPYLPLPATGLMGSMYQETQTKKDQKGMGKSRCINRAIGPKRALEMYRK